MSRWHALRSWVQSLVFPSRADRRGVPLVDDFARDLKYAARLQVNPRAAVTEVRRVAEMVREATRQPAFRMTLLFWFAALSSLLAAIGMYGLVSQSVTQRLREIAVRLALGAERAAVVRTIIRRPLAAAAAGLAIGAVAAFMLGRALEAMLYGVRPR